jgi:imidazolonepropionase-like amidohydrolase
MSLVFDRAQTITMDGREPCNIPITVDGDRIVGVGLEPRADATIVDLGGLTLIPGMLDLHTHIGGRRQRYWPRRRGNHLSNE